MHFSRKVCYLHFPHSQRFLFSCAVSLGSSFALNHFQWLSLCCARLRTTVTHIQDHAEAFDSGAFATFFSRSTVCLIFYSLYPPFARKSTANGEDNTREKNETKSERERKTGCTNVTVIVLLCLCAEP